MVWLEMLLKCTHQVMCNHFGMTDEANYAEFTRVVVHIKYNVSLSNMVNTQAYPAWISECAKFSVTSFMRYNSNYEHLLEFWANMAVGRRLLNAGDSPSGLEALLPRVIIAFIDSRMQTGKRNAENPVWCGCGSGH